MRRTATRLTTTSARFAKSALVGGTALCLVLVAPLAYADAAHAAPRPRHLPSAGAADLIALALLTAGLLAAGFFLTLGVLQVDREEE